MGRIRALSVRRGKDDYRVSLAANLPAFHVGNTGSNPVRDASSITQDTDILR